MFAGKRKNPHLSAKKRLFVEKVRQIFVEEGLTTNPDDKDYQDGLDKAREIARQSLKEVLYGKSRKKNRLKSISRRINRGLHLSASRRRGY